MNNTLPTEIKLEVTVRDGVITDVGPFRHSVIWDDTGESSLTYCNRCGGATILSSTLDGNTVVKIRDTDIRVEGLVGELDICSKCRCFQGFTPQL